ncbi:MAG: Gfo/Idh/MocA family oxidoreductase, partial [Clostridia bacterium]|nr:Gfo/Idh/MocA family oxidoreductase [Clostridia bacterium]
MEKLRIAIIGTGGISNVHTGGYKAIPDKCEIVAVCDLDGEKAKKYAEANGVPAYYTDFNEMFAKEKIDAVSVCTWNSSHKPATSAALNAGCHVLCEKPMAMTTAEAEE